MNFFAGKLTVAGEIAAAAVQQAAAAEHLLAEPEAAASAVQRRPRRELQFAAAAGALLLAGWLAALLLPAASAGLFAATMLLGGYPNARKGWRSLRQGRCDANVLMAVALLGAALIGQWREGAVVAFLFNVAEALEAGAMQRARGAIGALVAMAPKVALRRAAGGDREVPVQLLLPGDLVLVRPGERLPVDGRVRSGESAVDQAAITGESLPVAKAAGDTVFAGTLNGDGSLEVEVTRLVGDTTLARITHLVEEAQGQKAPAQRFVDAFARYYTPAVMALAAAVMLLPPLLLHQAWSHWVYEGLALLVVSCPCALVISTPVALVSAIASAARSGVLIKGGLHLEQAGRLQAVAFDKTGTLTLGKPVLTDVVPLVPDLPACLLCLAGGLERHSQHPLAQAICQAPAHPHALPEIVDFRSITGKGASATIDGRHYYVGSSRLFAELGVPTAAADQVLDRLQAAGKSAVILGTDDELLAVFGVADRLRDGSAAALQDLRRLGIRHTVMLTGDSAASAEAVAAQAGGLEVLAGLLPEDKVAAVQALRRRYGAVAMVGDGINDAPALATASLGVAMGAAGTGVALETADVVLMGDDLARLPDLIRLSRRAMGVIRQNMALALGLKLLAMLAVVPGWLTLWLAIAGDMGATLLVTLNGLRLFWARPVRRR